jgi:PIN domain nuclease of toxin-antitoxin system
MLLDTNMIIFLVREPARVPAAVMRRLRDPDEYRCTSILSFVEICTKHRKGKLPMPDPFPQTPAAAFASWCARAVIDVKPLQPAHIEAAMRLAFAHEDPFDRLIAATAIVEGEELVTSDANFAKCAGLRVIQV